MFPFFAPPSPSEETPPPEQPLKTADRLRDHVVKQSEKLGESGRMNPCRVLVCSLLVLMAVRRMSDVGVVGAGLRHGEWFANLVAVGAFDHLETFAHPMHPVPAYLPLLCLTAELGVQTLRRFSGGQLIVHTPGDYLRTRVGHTQATPKRKVAARENRPSWGCYCGRRPLSSTFRVFSA